MITLETLNSATDQEVFDQVAKHLLTQHAKSRVESAAIHGDLSCAYRDENGLKCAAGCLIGDEEYDSTMEGKTWEGLIDERVVPGSHSKLISELQLIHDCYPVNDERCLYRSHDGLKCAAGCLIGDDEYNSDMEGYSWEKLILDGRVPKDHSKLILALQWIHDLKPVRDWRFWLNRVAEDYQLRPIEQ